MIKKFAVDPKAMGSSWENFLYLIEKFGFDKGRIIAKLPNGWEKAVQDAATAANVPDVKFSSIEDRLRRAAKTAICRQGQVLDSSLGDWRANAIYGVARGEYHAVIASENDDRHQSVLKVGDFSEDTDLFKVQRSWEVPRTVAGISESVRPFLQNAKIAMVVDPYFDARNLGQDFTGPLAEMLRIVSGAGIMGCRVQVHFKSLNKSPNLDFYERNAKLLFRPILPLMQPFELFEWTERVRGDHFHDRYLLTDCGGLAIGAGFSAVAPEQKLGITLLDWQDCRVKASRFLPGATAFDPVGSGLRVEVDGQTKRLKCNVIDQARHIVV